MPDESVDLITVAQALPWFDLKRFYAEAKRVLSPGGVLAAWTYGINEVEGDSLNQLVQDFYANIVGPYWPPERKLVEGGYRVIPFPFVEITTPAFRMEARWTLEVTRSWFVLSRRCFIAPRGCIPSPRSRQRADTSGKQPRTSSNQRSGGQSASANHFATTTRPHGFRWALSGTPTVVFQL